MMIGNILSAKKGKRRAISSSNSVSAVGDSGTLCSADGERSVAMTVSSQSTIKASNKKPPPPARVSPSPTPGNKKSLGGGGMSGWKSLKRLVAGSSSSKSSNKSVSRSHSKSEDFLTSVKAKPFGSSAMPNPLRQRILSEGGDYEARDFPSVASMTSPRMRSHFDSAIRGRLDGVDILSLGPARTVSLWWKAGPEPSQHEIPDLLQMTFVGASNSASAADLVTDTIWTAFGQEVKEIVMEGYVPGERWRVRLGETPSSSICRESVKPRASIDETDDWTAELTDDGSTSLAPSLLWDCIWGSDSTPPPTPGRARKGNSTQNEEDVAYIANVCSVPVDLDEDTFIVDSPEHYISVLDVAMVPLQELRYESTFKILEKLLKGLEQGQDERFEHLKGCVNHNIGMVLMCQSNFRAALEKFKNAVNIRMNCLPQNHPDVVVSLMRKGEAMFALEKYKGALKAFQLALGMSPTEDASRAKILNNIGVVYYQQDKFSDALNNFTSALEIQRQWLDGVLRRETIVYEASVTLGNMGKVFLEFEKYDAAYSVFEEAFLLQTTTYHKDHDLLLNGLENLALTLAKGLKYQKAIPILRCLLRSKISRFGSNSKRTVETKGLLATILVKVKEFDEASELLNEISNWQSKNLESRSPSVKTTKELKSTIRDFRRSGKAPVLI